MNMRLFTTFSRFFSACLRVCRATRHLHAAVSGFRLRGLLCGVLLVLLPVSSGYAGRPLEIYGSTTVEKEVLEPLSLAFEKETGTILKLHGTGTGQGMVALLQGKADAAMASEPLEDAILSARKSARKLGITIAAPGNLMYHELARDRMLVVVNKHNPVVQLTRSQLKDIHTGKIANWQVVGGENLPIQVITSHVGSATRAVFQKQVMDGEEYAKGAQEVDSTRLELDLVSQAKGGIGVVSATFFAQNVGRAKFIKAPLLTRPLGLITIGQPNTEVRELIDYARAGVK